MGRKAPKIYPPTQTDLEEKQKRGHDGADRKKNLVYYLAVERQLDVQKKVRE